MGTFASAGGMLGTWSTKADYCASGVTSSVLGTTTVVWFAKGMRSRTGDWISLAGFKLSLGTVGTQTVVSVETAAPFREVTLQASQCARLDVQLRPQPGGGIAADAELDCNVEGGHVTASVHAPSCS